LVENKAVANEISEAIIAAGGYSGPEGKPEDAEAAEEEVEADS